MFQNSRSYAYCCCRYTCGEAAPKKTATPILPKFVRWDLGDTTFCSFRPLGNGATNNWSKRYSESTQYMSFCHTHINFYGCCIHVGIPMMLVTGTDHLR
jgi:hypothetical protein